MASSKTPLLLANNRCLQMRPIVCPGAARGGVCSGGGRHGVKDAMLTDPTKTKKGRTKKEEQ